MASQYKIPKPIILVVLDGFGIAPTRDYPGDATRIAKIPTYQKLWLDYPHTKLQASGKSVGLPKSQDGSSQVGHLNLGAGRIVYQDLERINRAIADGAFFENSAFMNAVDHVKKNNSNLHLMGVLEQSAVHASLDHLFALLSLLRKEGLTKNVFLHVFTDGRDDPPHEGATLIAEIEKRISEMGIGTIATVSGRYYAMDRDNRWERTKDAYYAIVLGKGIKAKTAKDAVLSSYDKDETDEFVKPSNVIDENGKPIGLVKDNDAVIFFNHRVDRSRQLSKAFVLPNFDYVVVKKDIFDERYPLSRRTRDYKVKTFERPKLIENLFFVTMTRYERGLPVSGVAYPRHMLNQTLSEVISDYQKRQLHITETEKERFVGYYFNGLREEPFPGEDEIIVPSPSVATYDLKPEMSAFETTEILIQKVKQKLYDFILINYANPDMVGHTGILEAGVKACEVVDLCLSKLLPVVKGVGGALIITADHGNVEEMINLETGEVDTEHSNFPVPFIYVNGEPSGLKTLQQGILADVAPTILDLMRIPRPSSMTGRNLLK